MKPYAPTLLSLLLSTTAVYGQGAVVQSQPVVPGNFASWAANGVIKDKAAEMSGQLRQRQLAQNQLVQGDPVRRRWPLAAAAAGAVLVGFVLVRRRRRR